VLFALLFFCMTYAHQKKFDSPTPFSRLDLSRALSVHGSVNIDDYHTNTPDKALFDDHYLQRQGACRCRTGPNSIRVRGHGSVVASVDLDLDSGWLFSGRTWDWPAGPTLGPRLLSPMIPLLALPCALGLQSFPRIGMPLAAYSILITTVATLTDASPPFNNHPNPLFDLHIPSFLKAEFSPNLGMVLGLSPYVSIAPYCG